MQVLFIHMDQKFDLWERITENIWSWNLFLHIISRNYTLRLKEDWSYYWGITDKKFDTHNFTLQDKLREAVKE